MKNEGRADLYLVMAQTRRLEPQPVGTGVSPAAAIEDARGRGMPVDVDTVEVVPTDQATFERAVAHLKLWDDRLKWAAMVGDDLTCPLPGYEN